MDGIFRKQRFGNKYTIIGLFAGLFLLCRFGYFLFSTTERNWDDIIFISFFACFGLFMIIACTISLYVNKKAFIHMDEEKISAFCHFGLSLKCNISDVKAVSCSAISITINLKNGKNYNIINLENGYELSKYIQKRMTLQQTILENTEEAKAAILALKVRCKKESIASITCFLLTIPGIILTSALTNWKELHEFGRQEWIIFSIMFAIGVLAVILMCIFLRKYLFDNDRCVKTQKALYQTLLRTAPIQPGNAIKVFLDDEYHASYRLVIFGFPNSEKVYFTAEDIDQQFEMHLFYTSQIYADMDALNAELEDMIEIPLPEVL